MPPWKTLCCEIRSITDLLAPKAASGKASADRFGEADHVGLNVEVFAGAAPAEFGSGFYFVEDQERAVFGGEVAKSFQEAGLRDAEADVHENRFENDRGDLAGIFFEAALDGGEIVEGCDLHVVDCGLRHAESAGNGIWGYRCRRTPERAALR